MNKEPEITDTDREVLANLIKEGFTSGRLDCQTDDLKKTKYIAWELKTGVWED